jgi:hypothetical protein
MATAEAAAAAEIVREIAAVCAADPLRADCLRLARKVSLLPHLLAEVADAASADPEAVAWVADLLRALQAAKRFITLGRAPPAPPATDQVTSGTLPPRICYLPVQVIRASTSLARTTFSPLPSFRLLATMILVHFRQQLVYPPAFGKYT